uniref:non-specific serine/threonine protein kinase n=1 Tax=Oryza sativa subsp. japonica TaxID=39947 RepID=Q7XMH7_ORYSJ|nr:OSJNBa0028I23.5 [Oryza sativa Japonica Group]
MALLIYVVLLFSLCISANAAMTDTISMGNALGRKDKLVSKNGRYALGFFETERVEVSQKSSKWYLGIWFNQVPKITPAWVANRDNPINDPTSLELTIFHDGNLVILNRSAKTIIWSSQANITNNNTSAMLLSSGNLILTNPSNSSEVLWQSFDYPTDTLFPRAKLGWDKVTGLNRRIISWKNSKDLAAGVYCKELDPSGVDQSLLTPLNSFTPYWSSGPWNGDYFAAVPEMASHTVFNSTFVHNDQERYFTYTLVDERTVSRHIVDVGGQAKTFLWYEDLQDWVMNYAQPKSQCDVYAVCGPYTICIDNELPNCNCIKGFTITSHEDWELEDRTGGCSRNTPIDCTNNKNTTHSSDKFYSMTCVKLPQNEQNIENVKSSSECDQVCLNNCSCTAYSFSNGGCSIWHNELLNIRKSQCSDSSNTDGEALHIRLAAEELYSKKANKRVMVIGVVISASFALLGLLPLILLLLRRRSKTKFFGDTLKDSQFCNGIIAFGYINLQRATKNFSEKLGGDFGMAKLLGRDFSRVLTMVRGTAGYLAPKWISGVPITLKVDVYSYGMVLLEIISGRRNSRTSCSCGGDHDVYFPVLVARKLLDGDMGGLVDYRLDGEIDIKEAEIACKVACWCIQDNEFNRPTMGGVVQILEGLVEINMPPMPRLLEAIAAGSSNLTCSLASFV